MNNTNSRNTTLKSHFIVTCWEEIQSNRLFSLRPDELQERGTSSWTHGMPAPVHRKVDSCYVGCSIRRQEGNGLSNLISFPWSSKGVGHFTFLEELIVRLRKRKKNTVSINCKIFVIGYYCSTLFFLFSFFLYWFCSNSTSSSSFF